MAKYQLTHLEGKLTVSNITRQSLFDADFVQACANCGKPIVNIATVTDGSKSYDIGLDCKKQLIDKPIIKQIEQGNKWDAKYQIKEAKQMTREAEKFLRFACNPENKIEISFDCNYLVVKDNKQNEQFPQLVGNVVYSENIGYLYKIGFKEFINDLLKNDKATIY